MNEHLSAIHATTCKQCLQVRSLWRLEPNMGLTTRQGSRVRKQDVTSAKNHLNHGEIEERGRIVVMVLDYAEDQARRRKSMTMGDWADKLDAFLSFNEREVLTHAGKLRADVAEKPALERYDNFDAARREAEASAQNEADIAKLVGMEKAAKRSRHTGDKDA